MESKGKALEIVLICAVFILLALWGIIWDISSGLLASGIDGIMLLGVCAMMAGIFLLIALVHLNHTGVLPTPGFLQAKEKPAAAAKAPAAASAAPKPAAPAAAAGAPATAPAKPAAPPASPSAAVPSATTAPARPAAPTTAAVPPNAPPKVPEQ